MFAQLIPGRENLAVAELWHFSENTFPNLLGQTLTLSLLDELGRGIASGQYNKSTFPTEAQLAKRYRVSKSVTRECMRMLTAKGMIKSHTRKGGQVQPISNWCLLDDDILKWVISGNGLQSIGPHLYDFIYAIVAGASEIAAKEASDAQLTDISVKLAQLVGSTKHPYTDQRPLNDFLSAIINASRNIFMVKIKSAMNAYINLVFNNRLILSDYLGSLGRFNAPRSIELLRRPYMLRDTATSLLPKIGDGR